MFLKKKNNNLEKFQFGRGQLKLYNNTVFLLLLLFIIHRYSVTLITRTDAQTKQNETKKKKIIIMPNNNKTRLTF